MDNYENFYDVIIIGGGPAGLSAGIYMARAKYRTLIMEQNTFGGQILITNEIVNYPGTKKMSGKELTDQMQVQARDFGAEFVKARAEKFDLTSDIKRIVTDTGVEYRALGVILALGASPRKIGFAGEKTFQGRGVAYCATCDGEFFTGKEVLVVGGGFAAAEEAMFLTKYASKVTILVRDEAFTCAQTIVDQLADFPTISVRFNTELVEVKGESAVNYAKLKNNVTGEVTEYTAPNNDTFGVFVFAGYEPATRHIQDQIEVNEMGYIVTDVNKCTNVPGVYAAGDVTIKNLRQVVTAVSDGAIAATSLEHHVSEIREKLHLPEFRQIKGTTELPHETPKDAKPEAVDDSFITADIKAQVKGILEGFTKVVTMEVHEGSDSAASGLSGFATEMASIHSNVVSKVVTENVPHSYIELVTSEGSSGIRYYSIPGGHEFNSFVIALYNVGGKGQAISDELVNTVKNLKKNHTLQVMATLTCTNCPDVVMGTQKLASVSDKLVAEMYDLSKFPEIKEKYNIMAVPCLIIDNEHLVFGKKSIEELVEEIVKVD